MAALPMRRTARFNTQPPEGGCLIALIAVVGGLWFQHTAARRRLRVSGCLNPADFDVSTHSRPKAAAFRLTYMTASCGWFQHTAARRRLRRFILSACKPCGFNTQPPEGGCVRAHVRLVWAGRFNTQPPEGGCSLSQKPCSIRFRSPNFAKLPRKARTRV